MTTSGAIQKSPDAFRTISEVADALKLPQHVLRFWETRFVQIKPLKRGGGRRFYRPEDVELLAAIRKLLYGEGYTIRGVQRILKEQGPRAVAALARGSGRGVPDPRPMEADVTADLRRPEDSSASDIEFEVGRALPAERYDPDQDQAGGPVFARRSTPQVDGGSAERPINPDFSSRRTVPAGEEAAPASPIEAANRLRAVLADLTECRRILNSARR